MPLTTTPSAAEALSHCKTVKDGDNAKGVRDDGDDEGDEDDGTDDGVSLCA